MADLAVMCAAGRRLEARVCCQQSVQKEGVNEMAYGLGGGLLLITVHHIKHRSFHPCLHAQSPHHHHHMQNLQCEKQQQRWWKPPANAPSRTLCRLLKMDSSVSFTTLHTINDFKMCGPASVSQKCPHFHYIDCRSNRATMRTCTLRDISQLRDTEDGDRWGSGNESWHYRPVFASKYSKSDTCCVSYRIFPPSTQQTGSVEVIYCNA